MCEIMSKGLKEALTVSIVTHVNRVESSSINLTYVEGIKRCSKWSHTFVFITSLIFNGFSIRKLLYMLKYFERVESQNNFRIEY